MHFDAIDHVILPVASLPSAIVPFQKLGWRGIRPPCFVGGLAKSRSFFLGGGSGLFHLQIAEASESSHPSSESIRLAVEENRGLCAVALRVKKLRVIVDELHRKSIRTAISQIPGDNADKPNLIARVAIEEEAGVPLLLCEYAISPDEQQAEVDSEDGLNHSFPAKRLDHLAVVAKNLDAQTHFWTQVLGVPLFGEVVTPTMVIRQFRIGDAIIELLGPNSADSPIHNRTPGLISMMSLEVPDLAAAAGPIRDAGFTIGDPAAAALPGTATATIPATETGGIALQLLQYC